MFICIRCIILLIIFFQNQNERNFLLTYSLFLSVSLSNNILIANLITFGYLFYSQYIYSKFQFSCISTVAPAKRHFKIQKLYTFCVQKLLIIIFGFNCHVTKTIQNKCDFLKKKKKKLGKERTLKKDPNCIIVLLFYFSIFLCDTFVSSFISIILKSVVCLIKYS